MDVLQQAGISTGFLAVLLIIYRALLWLNHRRISSRCCGRVAEVELDIQGLSGSTPTENKNADSSKDVVVGNSVANVGSSKTGDSHPTDGEGTETRP